MSVTQQLLETPLGFHNWLKTLPPNMEVGIALLPTACPLAKYLFHMTGNVYGVGSESVVRFNLKKMNINEHECFTPSWASAFIFRVDNLAYLPEGAGTSRLNAKDCLIILNGIPNLSIPLQAPQDVPQALKVESITL